MNEILKYNKNDLVNNIVDFQTGSNNQNDSFSNLIKPVLRRWRIVLLIFLFICLIGTPLVWLSVKPISQVTAAIRVAPVISSILFEGNEGIPMYKNFMHTQAELMTSDKILQRVADDLVDRDLKFFLQPINIIDKVSRKLSTKNSIDHVKVLRAVLTNEILSITPEHNTELIKISMKGADPKEMVQVVDSFVNAYMAIIVSEEAKGDDHKLTVLENERRVLAAKLDRQHKTIRKMAEEYGTQSLDSRQEIMLNRVGALQEELTKFQMKKISLEIQVKLLEQNKERNIPAEELLRLHHEYTNTDVMIKTLTTNIVHLEKSLIVAKQTLAPTNPQIKRKTELLDILKAQLKERRKIVAKNFNNLISKELERNEENRLNKTKTEFKQVTAYEKHLKNLLAQEDQVTIELGRKQLAIRDLQDQLKFTKDLYDAVQRRIQELEMERKRPARVSVAYYANIEPLQDKRIKTTAALMFAALACAMFVALLKEKAKPSLYTPADIVKEVGTRVIGTTTRTNGIRKALLPRFIADNYQTICANLGLFSTQGMPNKIVITSPGPKDGKTTLAINLATSIAKTGKTVLLIDGDFRKPDVAKLLKIQYPNDGIKQLLSGEKFEKVVTLMAMAGFDVLTAVASSTNQIYSLIAQNRTPEIINMISQKYDHIIIDSPPVLAVPDALLWAKIADAVILTCIANYTDTGDLKQTVDKLNQISVKIIGTVLNNVSINHSYYPYGYGYAANAASKKNNTRNYKAVLLPMHHDKS